MDDVQGPDAHEHVAPGLVDLQARLRGQEPAGTAPTSTSDPIVVSDSGEPPSGGDGDTPTGEPSEIQVLSTPDPGDAEELPGFAPVTPIRPSVSADDRLSGLADRLAELEASFASIAERREVERSDRLVALEQRLLHELASQRLDLIASIDDRFVRLEASLREGLAELHDDRSIEVPEPDEPA